MPAVVKCPNGCKLRVPISKAFDAFQCPKCKASLWIPTAETERFQANPKSVIQATLSSEISDVISDDILFLGGTRDDNEKDVTDPSEVRNEIATAGPTPNSIPAEIPVTVVLPNSNEFVNSDPEELILPPVIPGASPAETIEPVQENQAFQVLTQSINEEESKIHDLEKTISDARSNHRSMFGFMKQWFTNEENPGVSHNKQISGRAYSLAWAMIVIGVFLLGPVMYTMIGWIEKDYHLPLGRWSYMLIFFAAIQFLYALFLSQIPDWTATRFVSYFMLGMTVFTTFLLAISMLSGNDSSFFRFLELSVTERGKVSGWLLVMLIGFGMMSYLCGRTTQSWMEEESRRVVQH